MHLLGKPTFIAFRVLVIEFIYSKQKEGIPLISIRQRSKPSCRVTTLLPVEILKPEGQYLLST